MPSDNQTVTSFHLVEIVCTVIVLLAGSGLLLWYCAMIWMKALDAIGWAFKGSKYLLAYALDAEGRARAKKRVDSTRVSPNVPVEP